MVAIGENTKISQEVVLKRLRKIEGQIRGIQKMIVEDRDCVSLVIQLGAVRSATESVGAMVLRNCMRHSSHKCPDAATDIETVARAVAIWGRLHPGDQA
jgi:CsoR family transcriptional regulator, copper-sensing transcriptional repressor